MLVLCFRKNVSGKLIDTTSRSEFLLDYRVIYRMLFEHGKERSSVVADNGVEVKGNRRNADKERCHLCVGEDDVKYMLLDS